jgi:pyruvate/2-oxoglutarate dehydrogenase complex dihydrolipoamide dehydrogenase (E3) component
MPAETLLHDIPAGEANNGLLLGNVHPEHWKNPRPAKLYNLVVLGGGYGGIITAMEAARSGAKTALVERDLLGGICLNVGCISSKALLRTSRLCAEMRDAPNYGARVPDGRHPDFVFAMERMRRVRARLSRRRSARDLTAAGIDVFFGNGEFTGRRTLAVDGTVLNFRAALIATGARPMIPNIPGLEEAGYFTNETIFELTECPGSLLVVGGGPFGCELAQIFCRLGAQVSIVQDEPLFLGNEERDAAQILSESLARDGIDIHLNTVPASVKSKGTQKIVELVTDDYRTTVTVDAILIGTGRLPNVGGMNLEAAGVEYDSKRGVHINDFLQTTNRRIFAAGDVCLEHKFAHIEGASAHIVTQNALFFGRKRLSAVTIPWCTYTDPEIAHVGMYVTEARAKKIPVETIAIPMHDVDRAIADGEEEGFVKIHVRAGTDRILGATVVARHAGEMISDLSLAMHAGIGLRKLAHVSHPYPTQAAAIKMAANVFSRSHRSRIGKWLAKSWLRLRSR